MRKFLVLSEGPSDRMLLSPLRWILGADWEGERADLSRFPDPPRTLLAKIKKADEIYDFDLLAVHRDADSAGMDSRRAEIMAAVDASGLQKSWIPVVPERMTEAWFLFDEQAIRNAADNRAGRMRLDLPPRRQWDAKPDPKAILHQALRTASGRSGRSARNFSVEAACHRLSEDLIDFSALKNLQAFQRLEADVRMILAHM